MNVLLWLLVLAGLADPADLFADEPSTPISFVACSTDAEDGAPTDDGGDGGTTTSSPKGPSNPDAPRAKGGIWNGF